MIRVKFTMMVNKFTMIGDLLLKSPNFYIYNLILNNFFYKLKDFLAYY